MSAREHLALKGFYAEPTSCEVGGLVPFQIAINLPPVHVNIPLTASKPGNSTYNNQVVKFKSNTQRNMRIIC